MGKYVNGTFVPDENDLLLQQQQKMAGLQSAPQPQQAVSQPAPVTQPNPEVAEFAKAKTNNQSNNSPRVAGQAGTVYNIFTRPAAEQKQVQQAVQTPAVTTPVNSGTTTPQTKPIRSMDDLAAAMGYTSPEEEEKLRKASVANQRIVAVADALRQIGNIYNTTRYAPSQQFNSPVEMERQRYQQAKALRDRANQTYISYQQAKAAQDAKQRQWEQQFKYNMAKDAANYELKKNESEARQQRQKALAALDDARLKGQLDKNTYQRLVNQYYPENAEARIREIESRISKNNRTGGGRSGGSGAPAKYWVYDEDGNKHYYHNKTMYEQGVEQYGSNLPQTETYKSTDPYGDVRTVERRTPSTKKGGTLARNAESKKTNKTIKGYKTKGGSSNNGKGKAY